MFRRFRSPFKLLLWAALLVFAGSTAVTDAASATLPGIDISHYNTISDWDKVKQAGVRFVIAKATEGDTYTDPQYAHYKAQAELRGMEFTAYHFARPDKSAHDALKEADFFVSVAKLGDSDLIPVLDLEVSGGLSTTRLTAWTKAWLAEVDLKLGVKPMIYTNPAFWKLRLGNSRWFALNGYRLWIAHWTTAANPTVPASNWANHGWTIWQYTNKGRVDGITGAVDRDRFKGSDLTPLQIQNNR